MADQLETKSGDPSSALLERLQYYVPPTDKAFVVSRETMVFPADKTSYSTATNDSIVIKIPATSKSMEPLESFMSFKLLSSNNAARLKGSVKRLFKTLIVKSVKSGEELERINDCGLIEKILSDCTVPQDTRKRSGMLEGIADGLLDGPDHAPYRNAAIPAHTAAAAPGNTQANINAAIDAVATDLEGKIEAVVNAVQDPYETTEAKAWMATATPRYYAIHFHSSGILTSKKYLHLEQLGGLEITLELYPEATINGAGAHSYTLSDVNWIGSMVGFSDKVKAMIASAANNGKMNLVFDTWYSNQTGDAKQQDYTIEMNKPASNVRMALALKRVTAAITTNTQDSFAPSGESFASYQWDMGGVSYPSRPCSNPAWALAELHKSFGYWNSVHTNNITYEEFTRANADGSVGFHVGSKHYIALDLEADPNSFSTGVSSKSGNSIRLRYSHSGVPTSSITFNWFIHYTRILMISGDSIQKME
jgi:hypothetical protein